MACQNELLVQGSVFGIGELVQLGLELCLFLLEAGGLGFEVVDLILGHSLGRGQGRGHDEQEHDQRHEPRDKPLPPLLGA